MASIEEMDRGTDVGQRAAVAATLRLLGEPVPARFVPTAGQDEVWFVLRDAQSEEGLRDAEQLLTQLLHRKVWITHDRALNELSPAFPS